ncbi:MAG: class I SAM-dependent methyltransferase [Thermoplasmata archaeon]|nr:class I SAM-dependent methyltransferase [Thermoplasmata archaeon]
MARKFEATGDFVERLEGTERRKAIPPLEIMERMGLDPSWSVLDIGAGVGYFSVPLSESVREVVALDVETRMLDVLQERAVSRKRKNIHALQGDVLAIPLMDESFDHVLLAFIYHEVNLPTLMLEECARVLKPGGCLTIVDFQKWETPFGPPVSERKTPAEVERRARKWFSLLAEFGEQVFYQLEFKKM